MKMPKLLEHGAIKRINTYLIEKTGCFAFWEPAHQWEYATPNSSHQEVEMWSIALYTIYCDYGSAFLKFILNIDNAANPNSLKNDISRCCKHLENVNALFRPCFAHGNVSDFVPLKIMDQVGKTYIGNDVNKGWPEYFKGLQEEEWRKWAQALQEESNHLYDTLFKWADEYEKSLIPFELVDPKKKFSKAIMKSINYKLLFNDLDRDYYGIDGKKAEDILGKFAESHVKSVSEEIKQKYETGSVKEPSEIINMLRIELKRIHSRSEGSSVSIANSMGFSLNNLR